jgi:hypothetical protein
VNHNQIDEMIKFVTSGQFFLANEEDEQHNFGDIDMIFLLLAVEENMGLFDGFLDEVSEFFGLPIGDLYGGVDE